MNGEIKVTSQLGSGSQFYVYLPLDQAQIDENILTAKNVEFPDLTGKTILLAEDNKINQLVASAMLEPTKATIIIANNGLEAVSLYESHKPDIIFMDIQMPVMDGVQATKIIREQQTGKTTPIIAMTANTMKPDIEHYLDIGMDGYLTKPFNKDHLNSLLNVYNPKNSNLKNLAVKVSNPNITSERKLKQICNELKKLISNADRVSVWLFNHDYTAINSLICLDEKNEIVSNAVLKAEDFPAYFDYILEHKVLDASDAVSYTHLTLPTICSV